MKKRMLSIVTMVILVTVMLAGCKKKDVLIVGTEAGFPPYEYTEGTKVVGIDIDIVQAIADEMGKELEVKNMDFDGALLAVQNGTVDLVAAGLSITEDRDKLMDFSIEYAEANEVIVINKENPVVATVDAEGLADKIIGVQQGNTADWFVEDNVAYKEVKRYTKFAQAAEDLKLSKIDCIIMDELPAQKLITSNPELEIMDGILFTDKYALAVDEGNKELLDEINKVLQDLKDSGKIEEFSKNHLNID